MGSRPKIPAEVGLAILRESGHRCAVCGESCPLEKAHIVPWCKSKEHSAENLICLCANCHERADNEKWGEKALREYKRNPWILRRRDVSPKGNEGQNSIKDLSFYLFGEQLKKDEEVTKSLKWVRLKNRGSFEYGITLKLDFQNSSREPFNGSLDVTIQTPEAFTGNENGYKTIATAHRKVLHITSREFRILPGSWEVVEFTIRADIHKLYSDFKKPLMLEISITSEKDSIICPLSIVLPEKNPTSISKNDFASGRNIAEEGLGPIEKHAFWDD